jgi:hypothetical protein
MEKEQGDKLIKALVEIADQLKKIEQTLRAIQANMR